MNAPLLHMEDLTIRFRGVAALEAVSFSVDRGEIVALIGPNGAGKTTVLNLISGLERPQRGRIRFRNKTVSEMTAHRIARLGIARTYQASQILARLSVVENVLVRYASTRVPFFLAGFWLPFIYREEHRHVTRAYEILDFIGLYDKADRRIDQVSYQEQKLVELGRCLAMEPDLLLLDEPFGGLHRGEIETMAARIEQIRRSGVSVLLIDHHFETVAGLADRMVVLDHGQVAACGTVSEIRRNENVQKTYLHR